MSIHGAELYKTLLYFFRVYFDKWIRMATRNPDNDKKLLQAQYARLKDALDGFYSEVQALNVVITLLSSGGRADHAED
jgi:hypothetical protein